MLYTYEAVRYSSAVYRVYKKAVPNSRTKKIPDATIIATFETYDMANMFALIATMIDKQTLMLYQH